MLTNWKITKTFVSGTFAGMTIVDDLKRHDIQLGAPFEIGKVYGSFGSFYRVDKVKRVFETPNMESDESVDSIMRNELSKGEN